MNQFQLISATFKPRLSVKDKSKSAIGKRFYFECMWRIEKDDSDIYLGQYAWRPIDIETDISLFGWCPCEDLKNVFKY